MTFTTRWTISRKALFVHQAVRMGEKEFRQVLADNHISDEEFARWQVAINAKNFKSLKATYVGERV